MCELISRLDVLERKAIFLVDRRLKSNCFFNRPDVVFVGGFIEREFFLVRNFFKFRKILHFNNIGSVATRKRGSAVYFHNVLYLNFGKDAMPFFKNLIFKIGIFRSEVIFVQSKLVKRKFLRIFPNVPVRIAPFFNSKVVGAKSCTLEIQSNEQKNRFTIIYPSSIGAHKKHEVLAKALLLLQKRGVDVKLLLTIDDDDLKKNQPVLGYDLCANITNLGRLSHQDTIKYMATSDAVVHPSIYESFGLVLIEAALLKKPVVAPHLEYVHEVVSTDFTYDVEDALCAPINLCEALERALFEKSPAQIKVYDQFDELVNFLFSES